MAYFDWKDFAPDERGIVIPSCPEIWYLNSLFSKETLSGNLFDREITRFYIKKMGNSFIYGSLVLETSALNHPVGINTEVDSTLR